MLHQPSTRPSSSGTSACRSHPPRPPRYRGRRTRTRSPACEPAHVLQCSLVNPHGTDLHTLRAACDCTFSTTEVVLPRSWSVWFVHHSTGALPLTRCLERTPRNIRAVVVGCETPRIARYLRLMNSEQKSLQSASVTVSLWLSSMTTLWLSPHPET